jgi:alpha-D-ribose 1-methylphosphonate 5-triphosphate synthase subunit PhnL
VIGLILEKKRRGVAVLGIFHDADVRHQIADRIVDLARFSTALAGGENR